LQLPAEFTSDLAHYPLHPALLDLATGGAQAIIPGFDPQAMFYVPFSYGRVLVRRPMPAQIYSHVRLREDGGKDSAVFDATLVDEHGEEIATIERFVMRKVLAAHFVRQRDRASVAEGSRPGR